MFFIFYVTDMSIFPILSIFNINIFKINTPMYEMLLSVLRIFPKLVCFCLLHFWHAFFYFLFIFCFVLILDIKENSFGAKLFSIDVITGSTVIPVIPHVQGNINTMYGCTSLYTCTCTLKGLRRNFK